MERRSTPVRVAQDRRPDPRQPQEILAEPLTQDTSRVLKIGLSGAVDRCRGFVAGVGAGVGVSCGTGDRLVIMRGRRRGR
jgi:hypothetical protein